MQGQMTHAEAVGKIAALAEENEQLHHKIAELLDILRRWEPDYSSGEDRQKIVQAMYLIGILTDPVSTVLNMTPNVEVSSGVTNPDKSA